MMKLKAPSYNHHWVSLTHIAMIIVVAFQIMSFSSAGASSQLQEGTAAPASTEVVTPVVPSLTPSAIQQDLNWLSTPQNAESLASDRPLTLLAGQFIFHGLVDASSCGDGGLLESGAASPCGETVARNAVIVWQNQFDQEILRAAAENDIPPFILKQVFVKESQFWPETYQNPVYGGEYGLGHVTLMGMDTLLSWNRSFYKNLCDENFNKETCKKEYVFQDESIRAALKGVVIASVDADCSTCPGGVDLEKARRSVAVTAATLAANRNHVQWLINNFSSTGNVSKANIWRFTLASYNAGPGCFTQAFYGTRKTGNPYSWKDVSKRLTGACEPAVKYVDFAEQIDLADPAAVLAAGSDTSAAVRIALKPVQTVTPLPTGAASFSPTPLISSETPLPGSETPTATPTVDGTPAASPTALATETPDAFMPTVEVPVASSSPTTTAIPTETYTPSPTATPILLPTEFAPPSNTGTGEIVVKFGGLVPEFLAETVVGLAGGEIQGQVDALGLVIVSAPEDESSQVLSALQNNVFVDYAEPNYAVQAFYTPGDPGYVNQTYLADMQIPEAWDVTRGEGVVVAVIDTGVDVLHPDLASNIWVNPGEDGMDANGLDRRSNYVDDDNDGYIDNWMGWNFIENTNDARDGNGHGTHIAGVIAAQMDNGLGISGIAPSARILAIKALDDTGAGTYAQVAEAIVYAVDHGAKVINLGFGGTAASDILLAATDYAYTHGVIVVAAGGNSGDQTIIYPAANPNVIGVSALDGTLAAAPFSSYTEAIRLSAPGVGIYSTMPGGSYATMSGTSMSAAQVSGVAALLVSQSKLGTPDALRESLFKTALDLGDPGLDVHFGYGLVRAFDGLNYVVSGSLPTATASSTPDPLATPTAAPVDAGVVIMADAPNALITNYVRACVVNAANYPNAALGGTGVAAIQVNNGVSAALPIGFDFWYMGTRYTQLYASSNGWLSFNPPTGNTCATGIHCPTNDLDNSTNTNGVTRPFLAPLWDDLSGAAGNGSVASYSTTGIAPNRVFTFEWWNWQNATPTLSISMRVVLYESTGAIQFVYRQPAGGANPASASIGMTGTTNASYLSANGVTCPPTWSLAAETANIAARPATGTTYSFTPPVPAAPTGLNFTAVTTTGMTLNWTDASANENGFAIYVSTDGVNYTYAGQTLAGVSTYSATGLNPNTLYSWRVYAVTEGALSAALAGQQTTAAPNTPPTISITVPTNNTTFAQGAVITFTASASDTQDGDLSAGLQWTSSIDGVIGTGATFSRSNLGLGVHTITASATDSGGLTASASITVTVTDANGNTPPVVSIDMPANNSTYVQGTAITFSGTATDARDGSISANIQWSSSINGSLGTGTSITTSALSLGIHTITASVTNSSGLTGSSSLRVLVSDAAGNLPPDVTIIFPLNGATFAQGKTVSFVGSAIIPTNGNISNLIVWKDGATTIGTGASFGINTLSAGLHTITASATDSGGRTAVASVTITINGSASPHGTFGSATDKCAACHRAHTAQSSPLIASPLTGNNFCLSCHSSGERTVSTHSNLEWPGGGSSRIEPATFDMLCTQCHEPHSSSNLYLIRPPDQPGIGDDLYSGVRVTTSPLVKTNVVFTSTTGANSYDDGVSAASSRICVSCHANTSNPGYPMVAHVGGFHNGGFNYTGQDCTSCHPHSLDANAATRDGFMTGCRACHATAQDRGAGTPRRQIVGASGGDFTRTSHHVAGNDTVSDTDCLLCHEMTQHKLGQVRLFNQDNPVTVYALTYPNNTQTDADNYENFCKSCHDGNGRAGDTTPFSDNTPVVSLSSLWSSAQHNLIKLTFKGSCLDCHNNGHGSNKKKLLAPWNYTGPGTGTDLMNQEEGFCFQCHQTGSLTGIPVQAAFASYTNTATRIFKHDPNATYTLHSSAEVFGSSLSGANRHIECNDCHGPHDDKTGTAADPIVQPENLGASGVEPVYNGIGAPTRFNFLGQVANEYQFCFKCHSSYATLPSYLPDGWGCGANPCATRNYVADGLRKLTRTANSQVQDSRDLARAFNPANASFHPLLAVGKNPSIPAAGFVAGWSVTSRVSCIDCHTNATPATGGNGPHGSPLLHILSGSASGNTNYSTVSFTARNIDPIVPNTEVCFKCHDYATYVTGGAATGTRFRNGNQNLHTNHMSGGFTRTNCYTCHNSHGSGQMHLINFEASVAVPQGGRTSESAWVSTGNANPTTTGTCYVACHGMTHGAGQSYTP